MTNGKRLKSALTSNVAAGITDQFVSSLQNFIVVFAALHQLDLVALGEFTLAYSLVLLAMTTARSLVLEPLLIGYSSGDGRARQEASADASGASVFLALFFAVMGGALWGLPTDGAWTEVAGASLLALAALLLQDSWRFILFTSRRAWSATINDGACLVVTVAAFLLLKHAGRANSITDLLVVWAVGATAGGLLGPAQCKLLPALGRAWRWFRNTRRTGLPLAGSVFAQQAAGRLSLVLIAAIVGSAGLGLISASRTLLTPLTTLIAASIAFGVPEGTRALLHGTAQLRWVTSRISGGLAALTVVFTALLYLVPEWMGELLAGSNWHSSKLQLVPTALWVVGMGLNQGPRIGLRVLGRAVETFRLTLALGAMLLTATLTGAVLGGATGSAWGFGIASVLGQFPWRRAYVRAIRDYRLDDV